MSFGQNFATPTICCHEGFGRAMSGLVLPSEVIEPLYSAFEEGHRSGNPRLQQQLISDVLKGIDWRWPWLENTASKFDIKGVWPAQWQRLRLTAPLDWDSVPYNIKVEILSVTLSNFASTSYRWTQITDPAVAKVYKPTLEPVRPCKVSAKFVELHRAAVEAGDATQLPPYFPMDMVVLTSKRRQPR